MVEAYEAMPPAAGRGGFCGPSTMFSPSASPVAADGRIYLSNEDGEMLVVAAGREYKLITKNSLGELLMATPALSDGVMYVRSASSLFAIGRRPGK